MGSPEREAPGACNLDLVTRRLLLLFVLFSAPLAAVEPTRLVVEGRPGLPPSASRLPPGTHAWVAGVMDLVGLDAPGAPIRVVLAPESSPEARGVPPWVSGFTDGASNVVVLLPERTPTYPDGGLEEVLAHEVAHVLMFRAAGGRRVPRWFDEGVAMLAGRSWRLRDDTMFAWGLLSGGRVPLWKLDDLFAGDRRDVERAYALSGALVQELLDRYGTAVPRVVLARVARGDTFPEAIRAATGTTLLEIGGAFEERQTTWKRWLPVLTSGALLWFAIAVLAIVAAVKRRLTHVELPEEPGEAGGIDSPPGDSP